MVGGEGGEGVKVDFAGYRYVICLCQIARMESRHCWCLVAVGWGCN